MKELISNGENREIQPEELVLIIMGSEGDKKHAEEIKEVLDSFGVCSEMRIASAHKTPELVLDITKKYEDSKDPDQKSQNRKKINRKKIIYIAIAGRSNALGGMIDGQTTYPVINAPPQASDKPHAIFSSLDMPSGIAVVTVFRPQAAALAAIKMLTLSNQELEKKYREFQEQNRNSIIQADRDLQRNLD